MKKGYKKATAIKKRGKIAFEYNPTHFDGKSLWWKPKNKDRIKAYKTFCLADGTIIGLFQGSKGDRPELDFIVKFLLPGKKQQVRTPENMHWVVDLLLKYQSYPKEVEEIINYYQDWYSKAHPFNSVISRNRYRPRTIKHLEDSYSKVNHAGTLSLAYIGLIIELFSLNEKQSPRDNKMFASLLKKFQGYCIGKYDYYQLLSATKSGYR